MSKLLAASGTKEAMIKTIARYYYGSTISLHETAPNVYDVHNKKGRITGVRVVLIKGRYRFEETAARPTCECGQPAILGNKCGDCQTFIPVDTGEELPQLSFAPKPDEQLRMF